MDRASIITSLVVGFGTIGALVHETRMHKFLEQERRKHESHLLDLYIFEKKYDTQVDLLAGKSHQEYSKCMSTIHSFIHKTNHDHTPKAVMVLADARKSGDAAMSDLAKCLSITKDYWVSVYMLCGAAEKDAFHIDSNARRILCQRYHSFVETVKRLDEKAKEDSFVYKLDHLLCS